jgi:hypothetical protein
MKLREVFKHSPLIIMKILMKRLLKIEILKFHYFRTKLDNEVILGELENFDLMVTELCYNDFLLGDILYFNAGKLKIIKKRFEDPNYRAYGILEDDILKYSSWISMRKLGLPIKSNIILSPSEGYLEDDYCHPLFRGKGIHSKMILYRKHKLLEFGKTECVVTVLDGNITAINAQIISGARHLSHFYGGTIFGISFVIFNKHNCDSK